MPQPEATLVASATPRHRHDPYPASGPGALARWRPEMSTESLLLALSLYFTLFCNMPFWRALLAGRAIETGGLAYALAVGIALTALNFVLLAPLLNRWTTKPLMALLILVAATTSYHAGQFGVYFDTGMMRNVLRTDLAEAREFLTVGLFVHVLGLSLPVLLVLHRVRLHRRPRTRALGIRAAAIGLALIVLAGALGGVFKDFSSQMRNHREIRHLVTPIAPIWSTARVLTKDARAADSARQPLGTDARLGATWASANKPVLFVIVVGETARAANWGLNRTSGFPSARDTTPELARRDVLNFAEVTSCGTNTEVSLPCMFSARGRRDYDEDAIRNSESLLDTLRHAGLRVAWNDNQSGCKGVCAGVESIRPDPTTLPGLCPDGRCFDEALIEHSRELARDANGNLVLVLHQLGNHGPAYFRRHPDAFRRFTPTCDDEDLSKCDRDRIANSYDNALLYTDHVLARAIDLLKELEVSHDTALLYVSDHGESLGERGLYLHGLPYSIAPDEQTRVPMVMWFSSGFAARGGLDLNCLRARAAMPASHDNLFHTVLGLLDIETSARVDALDLGATCRNTGHAG